VGNFLRLKSLKLIPKVIIETDRSKCPICPFSWGFLNICISKVNIVAQNAGSTFPIFPFSWGMGHFIGVNPILEKFFFLPLCKYGVLTG
jgi:hypothetical protein